MPQSSGKAKWRSQRPILDDAGFWLLESVAGAPLHRHHRAIVNFRASRHSTTMSNRESLPPTFDVDFQERFAQLLAWRRDVRHFRSDALPDELLDDLLRTAAMAPSVGLSEPWRFAIVEDPERRRAIIENFEAANRAAAMAYDGDRAMQYARLKLAGLREAPVHLAVFSDAATEQGAGLGRQTMPETLAYSVVMSVHTLWLAARVHGVGVGWVSILDPAQVAQTLAVPQTWQLIAYLCLGYPLTADEAPELERRNWERRTDVGQFVVKR
jgi:5,6-dimethylbenzimidazole synthase